MAEQRQLLRREIRAAIKALGKLNLQRIGAQREILTGIINQALAVLSEKFSAVEIRFQERDVRVEQAAEVARISLDAALAAAKEAVSLQNEANNQAIAKSEGATVKEIDALKAAMAAGTKTLDDKIIALTARIDRGEGSDRGAAIQRDATQARTQWSTGLIVTAVIGAAAVGSTILGVFVTVAIYVATHH